MAQQLGVTPNALYRHVGDRAGLVIAMAQAADAASNKFDSNAMIGLAAAIAIGLAALGGTTAQGRATSAALEGIARQPSAAPRIQTPMILGLALIESLVLFAFVIAFFLQGKIQ